MIALEHTEFVVVLHYVDYDCLCGGQVAVKI